MGSPAVQTPFHRTASKREGRRMYRKQVLPVGTVEHPDLGTTFEFTADDIREMVQTFDAGAMTQVPFVLCDEKNRHTDDPERFRGEVKGLEAADDGLYALIEMTERGAALLEDNPTQPVSVRMLRPRAGKFAGRAVLGHVAATLDEVAKNMHPWEQIEASSEFEVTDLSDGTLVIPTVGQGRPAGNMPETDTPTLTKDDQTWIDKIRSAFKSGDPDPDPGKQPDPKDPEPSAEEKEADRVLAEVLGVSPGEATGDPKDPDPDPDPDPEKSPEPVAAALSAEDRKAVELATSRAMSAEKAASAAQVELAKERFARERDRLLLAGVPPASIELAKPLLEQGDPGTVELSNGDKADPAEIVRKLLESQEGTIELSERGSAFADGDEVAEAKDLAKRMGEQYGGAPKADA